MSNLAYPSFRATRRLLTTSFVLLAFPLSVKAANDICPGSSTTIIHPAPNQTLITCGPAPAAPAAPAPRVLTKVVVKVVHLKPHHVIRRTARGPLDFLFHRSR